MRTFTQHAGGIDWYCEVRGSGPHVVLIPSGEGDCGSFAETADRLADRFTVLTFDTPGFSRTSTPETINIPSLAPQIAGLVRALDFGPATFYGCSSGGMAVLDLLADHADLVRNGIIHEAAIVDESWPEQFANLEALNALDDDAVVAGVNQVLGTQMIENPEAWQALGPEFHERVAPNYLTWVRNYFGPELRAPRDPARFMTRPVAWTVGMLTPMAVTYGSLKTCEKAGITWTLLPCIHFPQVTIPDALADHIASQARTHLL